MGLFEEHLYRRAYAHAQGGRARVNLAQIDAQLSRLSARTGADTNGFHRDPYVNAYVLGMLDSITHMFETETRRRVGFALHEKFFVDYLCARFHCTREEARHSFSDTIEQFAKDGPSTGYTDGCADGLALCRGVPGKSRLFWHLAGRNAPVRAAQKPVPLAESTEDFVAPAFLLTGRQAV